MTAVKKWYSTIPIVTIRIKPIKLFSRIQIILNRIKHENQKKTNQDSAKSGKVTGC